MTAKKFVTGYAKYMLILAFAVILAVLVFSFCTDTSDNCGNGRKLNAYTEFCYNGEAYAKCGGKEFDPPTQFCYEGEILAKCGAEYNPVREFCHNKVIFAKCAGQEFAPDREFCFHNSDVYDKCNGQEFDPANGCNNEITLPKCGGFYINPQNEFCVNGVTYQLCNGQKYTPPNNPCGTGSLLTINIEPKGWGTVNVPVQQYYAPGTQVSVIATPVADSGGIFGGWTGASESTSNAVTITMNGNKTLTANFRWPKLSVSANSDSLGSVSYSPMAEAYPAGTQVTVTATVAPTLVNTHLFTGWSGVNDSTRINNTITITMNSDKTLTANFARGLTLTISVWPIDCGTVSYSPMKTFYEYGEKITLTATSMSNYGLMEIRSSNAGNKLNCESDQCSYYMNENEPLVASFGQISKIESEHMTDPRDGKIYKTVIIRGAEWRINGSRKFFESLSKEKRWMAENLNYQTTSGSWCYGNNNSYCNKYGRLYDWNTALTVCPAGWHLPSDQEWRELAVLSNGASFDNDTGGRGGNGGKKLKAKSPDWNGTDDYGFFALPGGNRWPPDNRTSERFNDIGNRGYWWTSTETTVGDSNRAYRWDIGYTGGDAINKYEDYLVNGYSVRCVADD